MPWLRPGPPLFNSNFPLGGVTIDPTPWIALVVAIATAIANVVQAFTRTTRETTKSSRPCPYNHPNNGAADLARPATRLTYGVERKKPLEN